MKEFPLCFEASKDWVSSMWLLIAPV